MSEVLVTGASGFLGGALVRRLVRDGEHDVSILVRRTSNLADLGEDVDQVRLVYGDLTDPTSLQRATRGVDIVFHSAARVDERGTRQQFWNENVRATEHLLDAARRGGASRFVFISSPSALMGYDGGDQLDIDESVPYPPRYLNLYSETKAAAERAVLAADSAGFRTCALRPRAIWGAGDRSGPIVRMLGRTGTGKLPDLSFGRTVYASLCHVDNIVDACVKAAASDAVGGKAYFIADAEQTDVWGFLAQVATSLGYPPPTRKPRQEVVNGVVGLIETIWRIPAVATRWSPPLSRYAVALLTRSATYDTSAATRDFGYRPMVDRAAGLATFLAWLESQGGAVELTRDLRRPPPASEAISSKVFRRKITPTERLYFSTRQVSPPFLMHLAVHGEGSLDPAALQRAVEVASAANPGARLVRDGDDWVDSGVAAAVRVAPAWSLDYRALENDAVLNSPIGPTPERTCEVLLLTGEHTAVVFRVFHGVMDGMGMRMWVDDVFRALRGHLPVGAPDPIADAELVARLGTAGTPTLVLPVFKAATGRGRQDPAASRWLLRHRTIEATGKGIVARVAAILAAEADAESRFMIPVDLRRHDPGLRSTANLALPLFLDVAPGESWETISARMRAGLRAKRELDQMDNGGLSKFPPAFVRGVLRLSNWIGARLNRNMVSATVSHMGTIDLDEMAVPGWTPTTVRVLPQHSGAMPLLFGMVESGGRLELTVSCRNGAGVAPRLEALLDTIAARLEADLAPRDVPAR